MGFTTPVDSVKLRIEYTIPVNPGDSAELRVRVKGVLIPVESIVATLRFQLMGIDGVSDEHLILEWTDSVTQGAFNKVFTKTVSVAKLDEDAGGEYARDELLVKVTKEPLSSSFGPSSAVPSNKIMAYFGVGENPPN